MSGRLADVRFDDRDDVVVARVVGEIDASNAEEVGAAVTARTTSDARGLVIDLSEVAYLDSTGVELLFTLCRRLRDRRQRLSIAVPRTAPTRRVLEISDIASVATVEPDADSAVAGLAAADPGSSL